MRPSLLITNMFYYFQPKDQIPNPICKGVRPKVDFEECPQSTLNPNTMESINRVGSKWSFSDFSERELLINIQQHILILIISVC